MSLHNAVQMFGRGEAVKVRELQPAATLLAPSVSSGGYVFSTRNLQTVNEESSCQQ